MFLSRSSRERKESCIKRDGAGRSRPSAVRAAWIHTETWARLLTVACFGGRALGGSEAVLLRSGRLPNSVSRIRVVGTHDSPRFASWRSLYRYGDSHR